MRQSKFTETQIVSTLKETDAGYPGRRSRVCRKLWGVPSCGRTGSRESECSGRTRSARIIGTRVVQLRSVLNSSIKTRSLIQGTILC